jgi:hypothetical protein
LHLKDLVLQMLPDEVQIKVGLENDWQAWLASIENVRMSYYQPCTLWRYDLHIGEIWDNLLQYLDHDLDEILGVVRFGEFTVFVSVLDKAGNRASSHLELTVVHMLLPLKQGWNLRSTPVWLADERWEDVYTLGDGLEFDVAIRYDAENRKWVQLSDDYRLRPLEGIYIHMTEVDQLGLIFSSKPREPSTRQLYAGWNLVALAVKPWEPWMPVDEALKSIERTPGNYWGYVQVVSPFEHFEYYEQFYHENCLLWGYYKVFHQDQWISTRDSLEGRQMMMGGGYWVYMENSDELAGFSYTPVPWVPD